MSHPARPPPIIAANASSVIRMPADQGQPVPTMCRRNSCMKPLISVATRVVAVTVFSTSYSHLSIDFLLVGPAGPHCCL